MKVELDLNNPNIVQETEISKKLTIDGTTKTYPVYRIRLDQLYYNDQNDRIATWISKYNAENGSLDVDSPNYNEIIHEMIKESNPEAFKKTKNNIRDFEQRESGVVLKDGRIIDGNRRFTCLRELSQDDPKFNYFDAVVLNNTYDDEYGKKAIKSLELTLQHGTEKQVDYDPINKLVGVYRDLIEEGHAFEDEEYARCINQKVSEVRKSKELAKLMVEFLEFINAPKQFYIAMNMNINGPLVEMYSVLKKIPDDDMRERFKKHMFTALLYGTGDMTRDIRRFKKLAESELSEEYLRDADEISDILGTFGFLVTGTIRNMFKTGGDFEDYGSFAGFDSKKSEPYANIAGFSTTAPSESDGVWLGSGNNGLGTWSDPTKGIVSDGETMLHVLYKSVVLYKVSFLTTKAAENNYNTFKCHYAEEGESLVFNALHLAWHAARVYRNAELVGWNM